jgi:G:T-mismatch repair DNA endonuclease (very short patch repair protein)
MKQINYILFGSFLVVISILLIRFQLFVSQDQYLIGMIPHHSMAIFLSKKQIERVNNNKILEDIFDSNGKPIKHEQFYFKNNKNTHTFTVDGYCKNNKTIKEFYGCFWHGCRKCFPENVLSYNKTIERENILRNNGYNVQTIWECEWCGIKSQLSDKKDIEEHARNQNINIRNAVFGGRTEALNLIINVMKIKSCSTSTSLVYILLLMP